MLILGLERTEEALDHRIVKAVALAAHALRDSVLRKHGSVGLHLVMPALVRMNGQFVGAPGARKRCLQRARNQFKDGTPRHTMRALNSVTLVTHFWLGVLAKKSR